LVFGLALRRAISSRLELARAEEVKMRMIRVHFMPPLSAATGCSSLKNPLSKLLTVFPQ
jgi:hypothetical protein